MALQSDLFAHLSKFDSAPFLFVGSGMSRRYLGSDDWPSLLAHFASLTDQPYARYSSDHGGDLPAIASAIASNFRSEWWESPDYAVSRRDFPEPLSPDSPLKIEVSKRIQKSMKALPKRGRLADELALFGQAVVEGVITTNYDPLLEHLFADFVVFRGQEELLFSNTYGVGEIYKIHGSSDRPETLVLTSADYERFRQRDKYLAAKLLTFFVEHPVVFLGYSLTDENVQEIITSVAGVLTDENLSKLQDRLVFIQWSPTPSQTTLARSFLTREGFQIPIWSVEVNEFSEVFSALGRIKRKLPARVLRRVKEQVYELAFTGRPKGTAYVEDLDDEVRASEVDVVIGVGVRDRLAAHGLVGWDRTQLVEEVLEQTLAGRKDAMETIAVHGLPRHLGGATNTPLFYYLRNAGRMTDEGKVDKSGLNARVVERVDNIRALLQPPQSGRVSQKRRAGKFSSFTELAAAEDVNTTFTLLLCLAPEFVGVAELREYLSTNRSIVDGKPATAWAKAVCYYDWLAFGNALQKEARSRVRRA